MDKASIIAALFFLHLFSKCLECHLSILISVARSEKWHKDSDVAARDWTANTLNNNAGKPDARV